MYIKFQKRFQIYILYNEAIFYTICHKKYYFWANLEKNWHRMVHTSSTNYQIPIIDACSIWVPHLLYMCQLSSKSDKNWVLQTLGDQLLVVSSCWSCDSKPFSSLLYYLQSSPLMPCCLTPTRFSCRNAETTRLLIIEVWRWNCHGSGIWITVNGLVTAFHHEIQTVFTP